MSRVHQDVGDTEVNDVTEYEGFKIGQPLNPHLELELGVNLEVVGFSPRGEVVVQINNIRCFSAWPRRLLASNGI